ncbi:MAG TPA: hypothetical protein VH643_26485 [Gemmataceae bacterium]|jgi:hypothetical protein
MGHTLLGILPRTRSWQQVVALIEHGAGAPQVANASIRAAETGLRKIGKDVGAVETVWLLTQLPFAARAEDFEAALADCGLHVSANPGLLELAAAFTASVDTRLHNNRGRTDLGEMAQMAAVETLIGLLGDRTEQFFAVTPEEVRRELAKLYTVKQFSLFATSFFARFIYKTLDYYLSRVLPLHVGEGRRFATLEGLAQFTDALELHCREAARYVQDFTGDWLSATVREEGRVTREDARDLAHGAVSKLIKELKKGTGLPQDDDGGGPHDR